MRILYFVLLLFIGCHKTDKQPAQINVDDAIRSLGKGAELAEQAMSKILKNTDLERDTYPYYLRLFTIPGVNEVFAATATFEPGQVRFYKKSNHSWVNIINFEVNLMRAFGIFSRLEDFNFDGYNDIALHYSTSNGCASEYFQLFIYDPISNGFKYIKAFSELGCPIVLPNEKMIKSRHASCACGCFTISEHKWDGDSLILYKRIMKDNHHDTLVTNFYNTFGTIIKEEKKVIAFQEADKLLNYYPIRE